MKNLFRISVVTLIIISSLTGCKKDNGLDSRDAFAATYSVAESWTENGKPLTKPAFTMSIEKSSVNSEKLLLRNFGNYGAGITVEAMLKEKAITITQQTLPNSNGIIGSGAFTDAGFTLTYTETLGSTLYVITASAKKL
jgi:hypothetical protein